MFVLGWMELDAEGSFSVGEAPDDLAGFGVPELHDLVESRGEEAAAVVREADVPDCLRVAHIRPQALPVRQNIPQLDR